MNRVNPAVGDAQRLRDNGPTGEAGGSKGTHTCDRCAGAERPGGDSSSAKPLRMLTIETTTPRRLCPGIVR